MSAALYVERGPRGQWRSLPGADYLRLLADQGGGCAICGATPKTRRLHTDHDHKTGRVRGLLCYRCNRALPAWVSADWLVRAAEYLSGGPLVARAEAGKLRAALEAAIHVAHCAVSALEGAEATEESVEQNDRTAEWARREVTRLAAALAGSDAPPTPSEPQ